MSKIIDRTIRLVQSQYTAGIYIINYELYSAGIGRTGTFISTYNIVKCLTITNTVNKTSIVKTTPFLSIFNVVRKLREQRFGMVTDSTQYKFIYEYITEWVKKNIEY
jgi:protein tyrosine phosphatase